MEAINAIYDGSTNRLLEPVPVRGRYEVVITFTKPISEESDFRFIDEKFDKRAALLSLEGILDGHEVDLDKEREERIMRRV